MRKLTLVLAALVLCISAAFAQAKTISGTVVEDANNEPVIGASVVVVGTTTGTVTVFDGNFTLTVSVRTAFEITSVGFEPPRVKANNGMEVRLTFNASALSEV